MRIVVNGQQAFGKNILEALLERGEEVVAVFGPPDRDGRPPDPVVEAARQTGLAVHQPASFKGPETCAELAAYSPDLVVMAFVTMIVPSTFLDAPALGTIQYHPSLLPKHRGPSSINWPIIQGETKTGLTIFWPDDGLDTGPVLLQKEVEIDPDDTLGSVYFDKLFPLGVAAMMEAVDLVRSGDAPRIEQDETGATYESWCRADDVEVHWNRPVAEIYNLIRGSNPQPGAWTTHEGSKIQIFDALRMDGAAGASGQVAKITGDGFTVTADGGELLVKRVRPDGGAKMPAADYVAESGLKVGQRLGGG
jgi:methionyl-tRNA formyltransferase